MRTVIFEFLRVAFGNDAFSAFIQHDDSLCKGEYACKFVSDNHHGGFARFIDPQNQFVNFRSNNRVQSGGRLVKKQDLRMQCHCPCQTGPFFHSSADFRRQMVFVIRKTDRS